MYYFKHMIDLAIKNGVYDYEKPDPKLKKRLFDLVPSCQNFVFTLTTNQPVERKISDDTEIPQELDLPFKCISIECLNSYITIAHPNDEVKVHTSCILINELEPRNYEVFCLFKKDSELYVMKINPNMMMPIIKDFLERLRIDECGLETCRERVRIKYRDGKEKKKYTHTIRKIFHICPKRKRSESYGTRKVDWSHAWNVRGFWRRVNTIGKNREGIYCVQGYTWVKDHVKGNKDKGIVKKLRVVK